VIVRIESTEGRPWVVLVTTDDGVEHRFVRSDDTRASALKAAHDGYDRGYANGLRDGADPKVTTTEEDS
jgi:hypothetical protein